MASSLHQWESDPLFSAAEVVQDTADRMESLFCLLSHDQNLLRVDHPDPRLLTSIEYHKRDLATILGTAEWQLEDFERAVNSCAMQWKSRTREDVISRHRQFIRAIREQINHVKKSVSGASVGDSLRNSEWVNLNEADKNGLALFLIGGNTTDTDNSSHCEVEDSSMLRRFLDPTSASSITDNEIVEHGCTEHEKLNLHRDVLADQYSSKDDYFRKQDSNYSTVLESDLLDASCNRAINGGHWDIEADEAAPKNVFHENKSRRLYNRLNFFAFFSSLWAMCDGKVSKSYLKRLKDGEEQRHSPTYIEVPYGTQEQYIGPRSASRYSSWAGLYSRFRANLMLLGSSLEAKCQSSHCPLQINRHTVQLIFTIILALIFFGILLSRIA